MHRRQVLRSGAIASIGALFAAPFVTSGVLTAKTLDVDALLFDPEAPTGGNPKGDVTIVAFFDYNCGYCRKAAPALAKLLREDGNVRLVYKDWPILSESSVVAAQLALAAKYQGRYELAHATLMNTPLRGQSDRIAETLQKAGIDRKRLSADLRTHGEAIGALLKRNNEQAEALELPGTPVYLVGPFKVAAALDYAGFVGVVEDARNRAKGK
ncbi:DsbA family protein [Ancylobacter radicis]|uniref:DsbA family protein n=1 Tax=Ancylobacter radicis TaxID=2836179 RepID=A0ABS5R6P0_9HYPH|nr:DsbA family protein [Ancylobacter radicis]